MAELGKYSHHAGRVIDRPVDARWQDPVNGGSIDRAHPIGVVTDTTAVRVALLGKFEPGLSTRPDDFHELVSAEL